MKRGATKEEIIRITQALIARNGIRAVRVDEIAQTLGISKRTLYEMFADKDDLINACLDAMSSKQRERIATYRKQRSGSALQRTFKLAYEYIANLYMVESSFLSDLRHKIIYADHFDEHREFWRRELAHHLEASKEEGLLLPEIEGASFADRILETILELRLNNATREEVYLFCRTILRGAATLSSCTANALRCAAPAAFSSQLMRMEPTLPLSLFTSRSMPVTTTTSFIS